jgi:hypothetical protein
MMLTRRGRSIGKVSGTNLLGKGDGGKERRVFEYDNIESTGAAEISRLIQLHEP